MTEEPKKNHWYEMYELECLKTKGLEAQIEKMKCCANCPVWLLNQSEKNCKDCEYKEALILLRR